MIDLRDRLEIDDRIARLRALTADRRVERAIQARDRAASRGTWRDAVAFALVRAAAVVAPTRRVDDPCADAQPRGAS